jgi:hypothetical protein
MKISWFTRTTMFGVVLTLAAAACSDDEGNGVSPERAAILNLRANQIAAYALSDSPPLDFLVARTRVEKQVSTERAVYARRFGLGAGRGAAATTDPELKAARRAAASALGTTIDPVKEADASAAQVSLDALLGELVTIAPGAASCEALPSPKNDACAYALIIIEVLRSEAAPVSDAGSVPTDAGTADGASPDGASPDAGTAPVALFTCGARDLTGAVEAKPRIEASETWSGKVLVKGAVYVTGGAALTIMPGTEIFMDVDSSLDIGWNSNEAAVFADGTLGAPIKFCGKTADKGFWSRIELGNNVTSNSVLRNVLISDGAGADAALKLGADVLVDNVQVRNAEKDGVWALDFKEGSKALSVEGVGGSAVVLNGTGALTRFPRGGMLLNNVENQAILRFAYIEESATVHNLGIPYLQEATIRHSAGELTFEAGIDYRFKPDVSLNVGWNSATAGLHVNGTAAAPVRFSAWKSTTSQWGGLTVESKVTTDSNITYAEFRQGGSTTTPVLSIAAPLLVDNVKLDDNKTGMVIGKAGLATGSKNLTIGKTKGRPLKVDPGALFSIPLGGTFTGNEVDQIEIDGVYLEAGGTINDLGVPYYFDGQIKSYAVDLVIAAGTDFVMGIDSIIDIGWNGQAGSLVAEGTATAPITFSGSSAMPGTWQGVVIGSKVKSNSRLSYVQIAHAGTATGSALALNASIPVTNSKLSQSAGYCLIKEAGDTRDYLATNTFDMCALGNIAP